MYVKIKEKPVRRRLKKARRLERVIKQPLFKGVSYPEKETFFFPMGGLGSLAERAAPGPLGLGTLGAEQALVASAIEKELKPLENVPLDGGYDPEQVLENMIKNKAFRPDRRWKTTDVGGVRFYTRRVKIGKSQMRGIKRRLKNPKYHQYIKDALWKYRRSEPMVLAEVIVIRAMLMRRKVVKKKRKKKKRKIGWGIVIAVGVVAAAIILAPIVLGGGAAAAAGGGGAAGGATAAGGSVAAGGVATAGAGTVAAGVTTAAAVAKPVAKIVKAGKKKKEPTLFEKAMSAGEKALMKKLEAKDKKKVKPLTVPGVPAAMPTITIPGLPPVSVKTLLMIGVPLVALPVLIMALKR